MFRRMFVEPTSCLLSILILAFMEKRQITAEDNNNITFGNTLHNTAEYEHTSQIQAVVSTARTHSMMWQDRCNTTLCETDNGIFLVDTKSCSENDTLEITTSTSTAVKITTEPNQNQKYAISCRLIIKKPPDYNNYYNSLTVGQLYNGFVGNFTLVFVCLGKKYELKRHAAVDHETLQNTSFSFSADKSVLMHFKCQEPRTALVLTLNITLKKGILWQHLPVSMLSNTVGYLTSPGFENNQLYPNNYHGFYRLSIANNESVVVSFACSILNDKVDFLQITEIAKQRRWREKSWKQNFQIDSFRSSLLFLFVTGYSSRRMGFKIMFVTLPRSQEPEQLPSKRLNCSVSNFHLFKPLLSCNVATECEGGEDEQNCYNPNNVCGRAEAIDADTKCYKLVLPNQRKRKWTDARAECNQHGQKLATFKNLEEYRKFKRLMPLAVNFRFVYIGAQLLKRHSAVSIATMYKRTWQWEDGRTAFSVKLQDEYNNFGSCSIYYPWINQLNSIPCKENEMYAFVCEFYKENIEGVYNVTVGDMDGARWNLSVIRCPSDHVTRDFLSCDFRTDCEASYSAKSCSSGGVTVPMFVCKRSRATVPYTLVCDFMEHCADNSDEEFCKYQECLPHSVKCTNGQCVQINQQCNGKLDCLDGSDEVCWSQMRRDHFETFSVPGSIHLDGSGDFRYEPMNRTDECVPTHFLCPRSFCLPVYLRCNGIADCVGREDEVGCDKYKCRGFYRCRGSKTCLHANHMCDGMPQCPEQDDELLCNHLCPDVCHCQGLAFVCTSNFSKTAYLTVRYLDASGTNMSLNDFREHIYLITIRLSKCGISSLSLNLTFPNLRELDLSWNEIYQLHIRYLYSLNNLRVLVLVGNPLVQITDIGSSGSMLLEHIDLSRTNVEVFNGKWLVNCPKIKSLNISWSKLTTITEDGFQEIPLLENLDVSGSHLTFFPENLLEHLTVYAENYKLCCEAMLPVGFNLNRCHATQDLLASCEDLLKSNSYRVILWIFASLSLVGNVFSIGIRMCHLGEGGAPGSFAVFVTNLSVADFFMGMYLAMIGTADIIYRGRYLWRDDEWKNSAACNTAGFLCLLSSEVAAFIICLITLDRFLVLRFPFGRFHFGRQSALAACFVVWTMGILLAIIPLLPMTSHWEFYSQTGICMPLPFTNSNIFLGYNYSFVVSILLNLILFFLIAVGQVFVYWAVRANSISSSADKKARDAAIARRLITVVVSDFLCWFPIGLLGLLASTGTPIPGYLNVVVATFVLPVNSALNPFLYTVNIFLEKRRKARHQKLLKRQELEYRVKVGKLTDKPRTSAEFTGKANAIQQIKAWINDQLLSQEDLLLCSPRSGECTSYGFVAPLVPPSKEE